MCNRGIPLYSGQDCHPSSALARVQLSATAADWLALGDSTKLIKLGASDCAQTTRPGLAIVLQYLTLSKYQSVPQELSDN